jgi:hypothetical protein
VGAAVELRALDAAHVTRGADLAAAAGVSRVDVRFTDQPTNPAAQPPAV